jgi:hypothetical protein
VIKREEKKSVLASRKKNQSKHQTVFFYFYVIKDKSPKLGDDVDGGGSIPSFVISSIQSL